MRLVSGLKISRWRSGNHSVFPHEQRLDHGIDKYYILQGLWENDSNTVIEIGEQAQLNLILSWLLLSVNLPGHFFIGGVHDFVSLSFPRPEQSFPPSFGSGLLHKRSRVCLPFCLPQVIEQSPQEPQGP